MQQSDRQGRGVFSMGKTSRPWYDTKRAAGPQNPMGECCDVEIAFLLPGQERWVPVSGGVRYDYCSERGEYFSCVARTAEAAQAVCEDWMMRRERY